MGLAIQSISKALPRGLFQRADSTLYTERGTTNRIDEARYCAELALRNLEAVQTITKFFQSGDKVKITKYKTEDQKPQKYNEIDEVREGEVCGYNEDNGWKMVFTDPNDGINYYVPIGLSSYMKSQGDQITLKESPYANQVQFVRDFGWANKEEIIVKIEKI